MHMLVKVVTIYESKGDEPIVGEEDTRVSIDIGPWVLSLASSEEDVGHELVDLANELEEGILREMLEGKLALSTVARVLLWRFVS